jgi:dGTPase
VQKQDCLNRIRNQLDRHETERLAPWACPSSRAIRRKAEEKVVCGHRQNFSLDGDRILHSLAYSRYIDKTQVFYLIKNDHITHRVLHVQLVSKIARTIGRLLRLNEDLIDAIALGHDIGHTPFGHDGETYLSELSRANGLGRFSHNVQGVRFLDTIERKGIGWNLSLQVLDGILSHDGEMHAQALHPDPEKSFSDLEREMKEREDGPAADGRPMTLEGCVVRMADTISYVGRDIEDAIRLGLVSRSDLPQECRELLGETNGTIVYTLVEDLVAGSLDHPYVSFTPEIAGALKALKDFNYRYIYTHEKVKRQSPKIRLMFRLLFEKYLSDLEKGDEESEVYGEFLAGMAPVYRANTTSAGVVRDFISGMTDDFFLAQCHRHLIPQMSTSIF